MRTEEAIATLHPIVAFRARRHIELCEREGIYLFVTQAWRSFAWQQVFWDQGRTTPGRIVTHARPGYSWHNWLGRGLGLAYDMAILNFPGDLAPKNVYDGPWSRVGVIGEGLGMLWGGRWGTPDLPHFEEHMGLRLIDLVTAHPGGIA